MPDLNNKSSTQASGDNQMPYKHELLRKAVHIPALIIPAGMLILERHQSIIILGCVTIIAVSLDLLRARHALLNRWIQTIFGLLMRPDEKAASKEGVVFNGATWALVSAFLLILIFPVHVAAFSISIFLIGDAAAALAGRRFGRIKWGRGSKTVEGSLAFLLTGLIVVLIIPGVKFWTGFLACLGACLAEALPGPVNDNLKVPLSAAGIMVFLEYVL
jgi:dolichol kinase